MTLQLPSEIVVEHFLPTARSMLADALDDRGFAQREIAARLGVSQAAVSQYLNEDRADELATHPRMQEVVERLADGFADDTLDDYEALAELLALVREFEDRGPICEIHEREMPALEGMGCDLCVRGRDRAVQAERDVLENVRRAVRRFANAPNAVDYVPNVGTNVAMALPNADDETDVAAVPGRLHAMRGDVNVPANPEFGASRHVATVLLAATVVDPAVRGAVNLATAADLLAAARDRGFDPVEFDAGYENRAERLRSLFADRDAPRVVYHEGDFGIEPITYVLGETAVDAVDVALDLVERTG
ncbi:thiamine-phosphate synthase family protein [Haloplanus sp. GCM10025708]|uniref:thiamine-phosphate synthase family protein n=1 Tax=Haloferacaceae TaxID=1644056 RepID=UPI00360E5D68